jgi:hypothetical protein
VRARGVSPINGRQISFTLREQRTQTVTVRLTPR